MPTSNMSAARDAQAAINALEKATFVASGSGELFRKFKDMPADSLEKPWLRFRGRGLHSSTFQLNLSAFHGIGGAHRGCVARVQGVFGGLGCVGGFCVSDTAQVELRSGRV